MDAIISPVGNFRCTNGPNEHVFVLEAPPNLNFSDQIAALERAYDEAMALRGLTHNSAVLTKLFLSDGVNQIHALKQSRLLRQSIDNPVAVSIVQQPPLSGAKIALLAYHVDGPIKKQRLSDHHLLVESNGHRHLWSTSLGPRDVSSGAEMYDAGAGTEAAFAGLDSALRAMNGSLREHCVRTWLYVKDIDLFYADVVAARRRVFHNHGFVPGGNTIASTGIEGGGVRPSDIVTMDAYSNLDLLPQQKLFLNAFDHMCRPSDYAVTFERGTKISYGDRAHLFISGTASIGCDGQILHEGDVLAQARHAVENVAALLRSGGASLRDMLYLIVYLRDATDATRVVPLLTEIMAGVPVVFVKGAVCRPQWLIEIEGTAAIQQDNPDLPVF